MMKKIIGIVVSILSVSILLAQTPSFPGAEGFGATTSGGRGGQVIYVTNLNCSGPGSLNEALASPGKKYILFKVSGIIDCAAEIVEGNCYIAGQTSPNGIIVRGIIADDYYNDANHPNNIIIRHMHSRGIGSHPSANYATDPIVISGVENAMIDHCTFSNSDDEAVDISRSSKITIQNCILAETVGEHYDLGGMLLNYSAPGNRMDSISIHHNNWNRIGGRMPEISCEDPTGCSGATFSFEYSCNLLWDQQRVVYHNSDTDLSNSSDPGFVEPFFLKGNLVNNYGMSRPEYCEGMFLNSFLNTAQNKLFFSGNKHNRYPQYSDVELVNCCNDFCTTNQPNMDLGVASIETKRFNFPTITYTPTVDLPTYMINNVGAFPRFPHEERLIKAIRDNTFDTTHLSRNAVDDILLLNTPSEIFNEDSDEDGMPDYWETKQGLNPAVQDHNGTDLSEKLTSVKGYTNLECYLNCLSDARIAGTNVTCGIVLGTSVTDEISKLLFSPNPAETELKVRLPHNLSHELLRVYNTQGTLIAVYDIVLKNEITIDTSSFPQGVFFIRVGEVCERFTKQ